MILVMFWLWQQRGGRTKFTAAHVNRAAEMVRENCSMDIEIGCVTRTPRGLDRSIRVIRPPGMFENVRLPTWGAKMPQCLRRLALFHPDAASMFGAERFVSMDIDCIITGNLDPLWDHDCDFRMYRGTSKARPYNGSMLQMTAGARPQVFTEFTPERAVEAGERFVGSDQAWISHILGWGEADWGKEHGVYWYSKAYRAPPPNMRLMFFPGRAKPWDIAAFGHHNRWMGEAWGAPRSEGRAIILGTGPTLWADYEAALKRGDGRAIIAAPEAAQYLTRYDALATTAESAISIARDMGFAQWTICGADQ